MRKLLLRIALLGALAAPALALALSATAVASARQVISDCNSNGQLTGHYSRAELQSALDGMSADIKEYTNCYDVIRAALMSSAARGTHARAGAGAGSAAAVSLPKYASTAATSSLPGPLIAVLIVLGLAALGGTGQIIRTRVLARHGA